jgi:integrase
VDDGKHDDKHVTAHDLLPSDVGLLHPEQHVFEAMIEGWGRQQRSRQLKQSVIESRIALIRAFGRHAERYPWQWNPEDLEFYTSRCSEAGNRYSTIRGKQNSIRQFCEYITDPRYSWVTLCVDRFGSAPQQICHEWNTVGHNSDYEGDPARRPLTASELETLFACADDRVDKIRRRRRKGSLAAFRSSAFYKVVYSFGLRNREACFIELADFLPNPDHSKYRSFGSLHVRYGKSAHGGPPRRRLVYLLPELDWIIDVLAQYFSEIRPIFNPGRLPYVFLTDRHGRLNPKRVAEDFADLVQEANLPTALDLHCLRHTYATHMAEWGYDEYFRQKQLGHAYGSSTGIYTHLGSDFKRSAIRLALARVYGDFKQ